MSETESSPEASAPRTKPFKWGFGMALLAVTALMLIGTVVGANMSTYPPWRKFVLTLGFDYVDRGRLDEGLLAAMTLKDWLFSAFLVLTGVVVVLSRSFWLRFFRSMHVGVTLVVMTTVAVFVGVLVPQIEGFEDPQQRITPQNYERNFQQFAWAEGYFLYHISHLYGWLHGRELPQGDLPPQAVEGLERYGRRYGVEEEKNRRRQMEAAFSSQTKQQAIYALIENNEQSFRSAFDLCTKLHLNRTYKSRWFASLLFLLGTSVLFNTFRAGWRKLLSAQKIGFFVTHLGILTLLAGGFVSNIGTDRGLLELDLREQRPQNTYLRHYDPRKLGELPFGVRLDHFARQDWKQVSVRFPEDKFTSRPPEYTLWRGREIEMDFVEDEAAKGGTRPRLLLRVLDISEHVAVDTPIIRDRFDPDDGQVTSHGYDPFPVAEFLVPDMADGGEPTRWHLAPYADRRNFYLDPDHQYRLRTAYGDEGFDSPETLFPEPVDEGLELLGTIELGIEGVDSEVVPTAVPFRLGQTFELTGGWSVRIKKVAGNFSIDPNTKAEIVDPRPLAQQPPIQPAVWLEVTPPDGRPSRDHVLVEGIDWRDHGVQDRMAYKEVWGRFFWDRWTAPGPPRYVVLRSVTQEPVLIAEGDLAPIALEYDQQLPLPGGQPMSLLQYVRDADFEKNLQFEEPPLRADGWDESFYSDDPCGVDLEIVRDPGTPQETSETVRLANVALYDGWAAEDGSVELVFFENDSMLPYEWRSVLSIVELGGDGRPYVVPLGTERDREIRVNDYLYYKGYRMFQTNADARIPTYSGIGIVYDPGIPVVLVGMYTIIAGTVLAFIVRPIVQRRKKPRAA